MQLNTTMTIDIDNFSDFIHSQDFTDFLLSKTTFETAAFILQTLLDKEKELELARLELE